MSSQWKRRKVEAARQKKAPGKRKPGEGRTSRNVTCPYCFEMSFHEVCTNHDERRPVPCPHCAKQFELCIRSDGHVWAEPRPRGRRGAGRTEPPPDPVTAGNVIPTLVRLAADRENRVYLSPPAGSPAIRRMQEAAERDLGIPVPEEYVALLRMSNGAEFNGAFFKTADWLVPENLAAARPSVIVLGHWVQDAHRTYEFVFDRRDGRFHMIDAGKPDERLASFDTFAEVLVAALQGHEPAR